MPVACVLITHLPLKAELLRLPGLVGQAVLIYQEVAGQKLVLDHSPEAREVVNEMPLEHALARCPYATLVEADQSLYRDVWDELLTALEQRSPGVEDAGFGTAYVDLNGLLTLYGDEAHLSEALLRAVPRTYRPRVGVAAGKFPAYIAALQAEANSAKRLPEEARSCLVSLSSLCLPTTWQMKERLLSFGLESIGSVARLPFDALQAQFGFEGARLWKLANGIDEEGVVPRQHKQSLRAQLTLAAPTTSLSVLLLGLHSLLLRSFGGLQGRFARAAILEGQIIQRPPWIKRIAFKEPVGDAARGLQVLRDRLSNLALPGPVEALELTLTEITGERGRQESLFGDVRNSANLAEAIRQARVQLGAPPPIYHIRELEPWSRIPERHLALVRYEP